ncbi:MAG: hypothetical protein R6U58_10165 [Bacteroidales bacterium]
MGVSALVIPRVSILYGKVDNIEQPMLHIVLSERGVKKPVVKREISSEDRICVFFFMGNTQLQENDIITIIGEPKGIKALFNKYIHEESSER